MEKSFALRLPAYQSHKIVRAARIIAIETQDTGQGTLILDIPADVTTQVQCQVTSAYLQKHKPEVGGWYVLYSDGYESFSPSEAFEEGYRVLPGLPAEWVKSIPASSIGWAVKQLWNGLRVRRAGWNGKGMWLQLQVPDEHSKITLPYVYIEYPEGHAAYPNGSRVPWNASQSDLLAVDWEIAD